MRAQTQSGERSRGGKGAGGFIAVAATVLLVVSAAVAGIFFMAPGDNSDAASFSHPQPGSVRWDQHSPLTALLIGTPRIGQPAASLTIVSLDPATRSVRMLSIPPNLWVTIPGLGQSRMADAYADGGPRLAVLTIESMTHVAIPYYAVVAAEPFRTLIDTIGGVTLLVPQSIWAPHYPVIAGTGSVNIRFRRGMQRINGASTLDYARVSTAASGGEEDMMLRQQQLLIALTSQLLSTQTFFRIPSIVTTLGGSFPTNFPYDELPALAGVLSHVPRSRIQGAALDFANQSVTRYGANRTDVLVPDWYHVRLVARRLFPEPSLLARPGVVVLNGSGMAGQAASLSTWLSLGGVHVVNYATAPTILAHTRVEVAGGASPEERHFAASLSTLLQVPLISVPGNAAPHPLVIIGRDYQDLTQQ